MTSDTGLSPVLNPYGFASAMEDHWTKTLGNASSSALRAVWTQIAFAFGRTLMGIDTKWQVLSPPTGSGKTQGTTLYCAILAQENLRSSLQAGVLIVTRFKAEADGIADAINERVGQVVAYAHHSDCKLSNIAMDKAMILVITHAALLQAFEGLTKDIQSRWDDFSYWSHGKRKLVIVDEALSGIVEHSQLNLQRLGHVIGLAMPYRTKHPAELQALEALYKAFEKRTEVKSSSQRFMWTEKPEADLQLPAQFNLYALGKTLERTDLDRIVLGTVSAIDQGKAQGSVKETLRHAEAILSRWAFYRQKGQYHTLNTALLLIPEDAPPVVVLDATASQSELWHLLGDRVSMVPVPDGARSYANVMLHVARSKGLGKHKMVDQADSRLPRLFDHLRVRLGPDRQVLVCLHKAVVGKATSYKPKGHAYSFAHWGDIDGKNSWQDHDAVVLFGLPYRDEAWERSMACATQGIASADNNGQPSGGSTLSLQQRQLSVSAIQAINRVRCRKVIDGRGNCASTDVFLMLPVGQDGEAILQAIQLEMPGVRVKPWDFSPDGPKVAVRRGSHHDAILGHMEAQPPGVTYLRTLSVDLGIRAMKPIREALNDNAHPLTVALSAIGVSYVRQGVGRSTKTYLLKAAA